MSLGVWEGGNSTWRIYSLAFFLILSAYLNGCRKVFLVVLFRDFTSPDVILDVSALSWCSQYFPHLSRLIPRTLLGMSAVSTQRILVMSQETMMCSLFPRLTRNECRNDKICFRNPSSCCRRSSGRQPLETDIIVPWISKWDARFSRVKRF